jgi:uncharacterized membrane protein
VLRSRATDASLQIGDDRRVLEVVILHRDRLNDDLACRAEKEPCSADGSVLTYGRNLDDCGVIVRGQDVSVISYNFGEFVADDGLAACVDEFLHTSILLRRESLDNPLRARRFCIQYRQVSNATSKKAKDETTESRARLLVMLGAGILAGAAAGILLGWQYAATIGWAVACIVYISWVWGTMARRDEKETASTARREDPTSRISELLTLIGSVLSLGAVVILIFAAKDAHGVAKVLVPILALFSVGLSWFLVHTLFTLRYARLFFAGKLGGINFNQTEPPRFIDFAYFAFTIGMTYQVSDTNIEQFAIRSLALRQGLLSYLFGAIILASTINLVAGLAG